MDRPGGEGSRAGLLIRLTTPALAEIHAMLSRFAARRGGDASRGPLTPHAASVSCRFAWLRGCGASRPWRHALLQAPPISNRIASALDKGPDLTSAEYSVAPTP